MPGIYKPSRHKSRSAVTPDVLSGEQDNTAKFTTLPDLSHAAEGTISSPGLTANPSLSLPPDTPFSSLSDGIPSAPFPGGGEAPSSTLPSGATRETFPVSRFIRQAWETVDDSCGEGACALQQISGNDADSLFSFIDEVRLEEAREFRQKGYNPQVPEVDPKLMMQLRNAVGELHIRQRHPRKAEEPLGSLFLLKHTLDIERFAARLSDDRMREWVRDTLSEKAGKSSPGNRSAAQSLVRRLMSTMQTLIRIADFLCSDYVCDTADKRHEMLVAELTGSFPSCEEKTVMEALEKMKEGDKGRAAWSSLVLARYAAWESDRLATFEETGKTVRHEAEKTGKKAGQLQGAARTFFTEIGAYFYSLSSELIRASAGVSQGNTPLITQSESEQEASSSRLDRFFEKSETGFVRTKLKAEIAVATGKRQIHRLNRVRKHGHPSATLSKKPEQVTTDSIIRSILWQWQQPAIKIQYASGALLSKLNELKTTGEMFSSGGVVHESDTPVIHPEVDDTDVLVRQWVTDHNEQLNPRNQRAEKLAVLEKLLDGNIDNARVLTGRFGKEAENTEHLLRKRSASVLGMGIVMQNSGLDLSLKKVDTLLPEIARGLDKAIAALDKASQSAITRNFAEAVKQAGIAQLQATKVKEKLSTESARLTERPLDEHSRGSRLAMHWANIASEQNLNNGLLPDAAQVLSSLKERGLLEGIVSSGDPGGYLFATRLASELKNARNGELRLPMSPEHYATLEKGLVEYIVKWGQKRLSRGGARLIIELAVEQGMYTVSFGISNLFRVPYKVLKSVIKVPYSVNKINNYIMPGDDKPYKAINNLLGKKLKQLGFNLITAPLPGIASLAVGTTVTVGAVAYNSYIKKKENTFTAVYERVVEGKESKQIKMDSPEGMIFDLVFDGATTAAFKGARMALKPGKYSSGGIPGKPFVKAGSDELSEDTLCDQAHISCGNTKTVSHLPALPQQEEQEEVSERRDPAFAPSRGRRKRDNPALQPERLDFDHDTRYQDLTSRQKKQAYRRAIEYVLRLIENDQNIPEHMRAIARIARTNDENLYFVNVNGRVINNMIRLSDPTGESGRIYIYLNSNIPYRYLKSKEDKIFFYLEDLPSFDNYPGITRPFVRDTPSLSGYLVDQIEADYKYKGKTVENKLIISRAATHVQPPTKEATKKGGNIKPVEVTLMSEHHDFDHGIKYYDFSSEKIKQTIMHAINFALLKIENDKNISENIRKRAYMSRIGVDYLMPVDINGQKLKNTFFIPDSLESKSGVLIRLDSEELYYTINSGEDIPEVLKQDLLSDSNVKSYDWMVPISIHTLRSNVERFDSIRKGEMKYFNTASRQMTVLQLSEDLANTHEGYKLNGQIVVNKKLLSRALAGAHIPVEEVSAKRVGIEIEYTWGGSPPEDYLRAFENPFTFLCEDLQIIVSSLRGEPKEETDLHIHRVKYIGRWVDITVGAITSLTPEGWVVNMTRSMAGIYADVAEGKEIDMKAVVFLLFGCLPEGKIVAQIGKFSLIGGKVVKYVMLIGGKTVDLAIVGESIKEAIETGEPLAIYQALLNSGLSVNHSYQMAKKISSGLKIKNNIEDSASLETLEAIQNKDPKYDMMKNMPVREFQLGDKRLFGKINNGKIEISQDGGTTWKQGSDLHSLAYRLQNAGGGRKLPEEGESTSQEGIQSSESAGDITKEKASTSHKRLQSSENFANIQTDHTNEYKVEFKKSTRNALKEESKSIKIKYFDPVPSKFKRTNDFTLAHVGINTEKSKIRVSPKSLIDSLNKMQSKNNELIRQLKDYNGADKDAILNKFKNNNSAIDQMKVNLNQTDNISGNSIYILVRGESDPENVDNHYGVTELQYSTDKKDLSLNHLIVHPDVVVNKYLSFRDYLVDQGIISMDEFEKFNIKNADRYLGYKALENEINDYESRSSKKVKTVWLKMSEAFSHELSLPSLFESEPKDFFVYVHVGAQTGMSVDVSLASLDKMRSKVYSLMYKLEHYSGVDKKAIFSDMENIKLKINKVRDDLSRRNNFSDTNIYMIVRENSNPEDISNHFGFAEIDFSTDKDTPSFKDVIIHPEVVVNNYPDFKNYLITDGFVGEGEFEKINIHNIHDSMKATDETLGVQNVKGEKEHPSTSQTHPQSDKNTKNTQEVESDPNLSSELESEKFKESDRLIPTDSKLKKNAKIYKRVKKIYKSVKGVRKNLLMGNKEVTMRSGFNILTYLVTSGVNFTSGLFIPGIEAVPDTLSGITGTFGGDVINTLLQKLLGSDLTSTLDMDIRLPSSTNPGSPVFIKIIKPRLKDYTFAVATTHKFPLASTDVRIAHSLDNPITKGITDATNLKYYRGELGQRAYHDTKALQKELDYLEVLAYSNIGISSDEAHTIPGTTMAKSSKRFYGKEKNVAKFNNLLKRTREELRNLNDDALRLGYPAGWVLRRTKGLPWRTGSADVPATKSTPERTHSADAPATKSIPERTHSTDVPATKSTPERTHSADAPATKSIPERTHSTDVPATKSTPERTHSADIPATKNTPWRTERPGDHARRNMKIRRKFFEAWEEKFANGSSEPITTEQKGESSGAERTG